MCICTFCEYSSETVVLEGSLADLCHFCSVLRQSGFLLDFVLSFTVVVLEFSLCLIRLTASVFLLVLFVCCWAFCLYVWLFVVVCGGEGRREGMLGGVCFGGGGVPA